MPAVAPLAAPGLICTWWGPLPVHVVICACHRRRSLPVPWHRQQLLPSGRRRCLAHVTCLDHGRSWLYKNALQSHTRANVAVVFLQCRHTAQRRRVGECAAIAYACQCGSGASAMQAYSTEGACWCMRCNRTRVPMWQWCFCNAGIQHRGGVLVNALQSHTRANEAVVLPQCRHTAQQRSGTRVHS